MSIIKLDEEEPWRIKLEWGIRHDENGYRGREGGEKRGKKKEKNRRSSFCSVQSANNTTRRLYVRFYVVNKAQHESKSTAEIPGKCYKISSIKPEHTRRKSGEITKWNMSRVRARKIQADLNRPLRPVAIAVHSTRRIAIEDICVSTWSGFLSCRIKWSTRHDEGIIEYVWNLKSAVSGSIKG